jgi:hypothetical protein
VSLEPVTDHVERGLSRLIEQFKNKPRIASLIKSYLLQVQELSDATWEVLVSRLIDDATGEQLTVLSRLVGETVRLEDDERQRVLVRARIAVNRSNGHGDDILRVASLLFTLDFELVEYYPAAMVLTVTEPVSAVPTLEHGMLEQAAAAGVRIDVHFSEDEQSELFRFGDGPGWGADEGVWSGAVSDHVVI